jgi:hypothetical protein
MMFGQKIFTEEEVDSKIDDIFARMGALVSAKRNDLTQLDLPATIQLCFVISETFCLAEHFAFDRKTRRMAVKTIAELKESTKQELRQHYRLKLDPAALHTIQKFDKIFQLYPALLANIVKMSPDAKALKRNVKQILTLELPVQDLKSVATAKDLKKLVHYKLYGIKSK